MALHLHHETIDAPVATEAERTTAATTTPVATASSTTTVSRFAVSPGQFVGGAVGVAACVFGVLAITRAGIDSTLNAPVVGVDGFAQSAAFGIGEVVVGLLLIAGAASPRNRSLMGFVGGVMFVAGVIIAAASAQILHDIGVDHRSGWLVLIGGVIAMVAAVMPVMVRSARHVDGRI